MEDEIKEKIREKRKNNWIEALFAIEALATNKDIVESSLKTHVEKLSRAKDVFVYEIDFKNITKVENPMKNIKEGFSQVADIKLFAKDMLTLISIILVYGPSSIEILGPNNKEIKINEIQSIANTLAGVIHQFAAAGVGGIVITTKQ